MFKKYKKLILSQLCAFAALGAAVLGYLRYQQTQNVMEQMTLSFVLFAIVLFAMEIRLVIAWVGERKSAQG